MYFIFLHNVEEYKYKKACKVHFNSDVIHYIDDKSARLFNKSWRSCSF